MILNEAKLRNGFILEGDVQLSQNLFFYSSRFTKDYRYFLQRLGSVVRNHNVKVEFLIFGYFEMFYLWSCETKV